MATRMSDSRLYAHLWRAPELDYLFEEEQRLGLWLEILRALAGAQAAEGIIPAQVAEALEALSVTDLDLELVAEHTRRTSHSTLGLIHGLQAALPADVAEYAYYGATVQDVSDTWFGIVMREVGRFLDAGLATLEDTVLRLAAQHRDTVMVGRTHGQLGAPITFGFKAASWADELGRHRDRLAQGAARWEVGQLAGAVGVIGFLDDRGPAVRRRFCAALELHDPGMSWTSSRDRVAEFGGVLGLICGTLARMGNEVYELQRPEIGELAEPALPGGVGSITMPHKRNPERSEHLATLSRLARAQAAVLGEGVEHQHERDGRAWKAEWLALPELCELTGVAVTLAGALFAGLEVHPERMLANLEATGTAASEQVLATLAPRIGKHRAQELLQAALLSDPSGAGLHAVLVAQGIEPEAASALLAHHHTGASAELVDSVLARRRNG